MVSFDLLIFLWWRKEKISCQCDTISGSDIYREKLVEGLAQHLQFNLHVFDSTRASLEVQFSPSDPCVSTLFTLSISKQKKF